ncbi:MAG: cysteine synthase family protein [Acidimicrobiia bacterium]|nr:cysteine synthase family protein [Acidimicrobiia bacterium]MDH4308106.1 cysteine synthase family protein [Acidimicrobiia bacterium]MDH5292592.1 cysteine synthase family protein [Acidimicrobiia bacterium]
MTDVVGGTPVVQLRNVVPDDAADVFVKLEWFNPTGSYKDRMALAMVEEAERRGDLSPGMTVVEYTGGSTGSSLAYVCAAKGYRFKVVSSDAFAEEKLKTMKAFGADVTIVPSKDGQITPDLVPRMIEQASNFAAEPGTFWTNQLHNADSLVGYRGIGIELLEQMDRPIDVFCAAVGTAGLAVGVSSALADGGSKARIVVLEPASTAVISGGKPGTHHVEGIGVGFIPPLLDPARYHEARAIDEGEGRAMARRLAAEEGLLAGTSSGLNVAGAISIAQELGPGRAVVTVAVDTGLKYLAGDLFTT